MIQRCSRVLPASILFCIVAAGSAFGQDPFFINEDNFAVSTPSFSDIRGYFRFGFFTPGTPVTVRFKNPNLLPLVIPVSSSKVFSDQTGTVVCAGKIETFQASASGAIPGGGNGPVESSQHPQRFIFGTVFILVGSRLFEPTVSQAIKDHELLIVRDAPPGSPNMFITFKFELTARKNRDATPRQDGPTVPLKAPIANYFDKPFDNDKINDTAIFLDLPNAANRSASSSFGTGAEQTDLEAGDVLDFTWEFYTELRSRCLDTSTSPPTPTGEEKVAAVAWGQEILMTVAANAAGATGTATQDPAVPGIDDPSPHPERINDGHTNGRVYEGARRYQLVETTP